MQVTELKNEPLNFHVRITIPASTVDGDVAKELKALTKKAKLPGFRPGKAPASIMLKKYGSQVRSDVLRDVINKSINNVISLNKLVLAVDPVVEDVIAEELKDLEFTVKFELLSKIELPDFQNIKIEKPVINISEKETNVALESLVEYHKSYDKETKKKAENKDQVTINAIGYVDGVAFPGGKLEGHKLVLGSGAFIPGFEDQLVGSKAGDKVLVKVTFPTEYHAPDLAGKESEFSVEVLAVHKESIPEINDELAKKLGHENVQALTERVVAEKRKETDSAINHLMVMSLFDQLENILDFPVAPSLVKREYDFLKKAVQAEIENGNAEESRDDEYYTKLAIRRVRIGLVLAEYTKSHNLVVTQEDLKRAVMAKVQEAPAYANQIIDYYMKNPKAVDSLNGAIIEEKAIKHIFDNAAQVIEKHYSSEEFQELLLKAEQAEDLRA